MNSKDRRLLERVHACLAVPFAADGSVSTAVGAICRFHADMQTALPMARQLMRWIATSEPYSGAIDEELKRLEKWFFDRRDANWQ